MLHARIAARAFNTPLLVEPSKAMAFLSGLGPRILGRRVEMVDGSETADGTIALPARATILAGGLTESLRHHGDARRLLPAQCERAAIQLRSARAHRHRRDRRAAPVEAADAPFHRTRHDMLYAAGAVCVLNPSKPYLKGRSFHARH